MLQSATDSTTQAVVSIVDFLYGNWEKLLSTLLIALVALALIHVLRKIVTSVGKEKKISKGTIGFLNGVIKYGILILAVVNILGIFSFRYIYSFILSLGLISVVIALGSQTIISNLMGGAVVFLERPFTIGDVIKIGDNIGEVQGINFRSTLLQGLNGLNITIPNSTFLTVPIVNYTRTQSYLLKVPFILTRKTDISSLGKTIRDNVASLSGVRYDKDMHVYKSKITPDNIEYEYHIWVKDPRDSERVASAVIDVIAGEVIINEKTN